MDLSWIATLAGAELIVAAIVIVIIKLGPVFIERRKKIALAKIEKDGKIAMAEIDMNKEALEEETNRLIKVLCDRMERIEQAVTHSINERHQNEQRIDGQYKELLDMTKDNSRMIDRTYIQALIGTVFTPNVPLIELFDAAIECFKLGLNGNIKNMVIMTFKTECATKIWRGRLGNDKNKLSKDHKYYDHFHEIINSIERCIL